MSWFASLENATREWLPVATRLDWSKEELWQKLQFLIPEDDRGQEDQEARQYLRGVCNAYELMRAVKP